MRQGTLFLKSGLLDIVTVYLPARVVRPISKQALRLFTKLHISTGLHTKVRGVAASRLWGERDR
jgi:hypothetical protein